MKYCGNCGNKLEDECCYCGNCGAKCDTSTLEYIKNKETSINEDQPKNSSRQIEQIIENSETSEKTQIEGIQEAKRNSCLTRIIIFGALIFVIIWIFKSCFGSNPIKQVEGRWVLEYPVDTYTGVTINGDGTGSIDFSGKDHYSGKNKLIMRQAVKIEVDGNDLYLHFVDNPEFKPGHVYVKDGTLFSDDGKPFRKVR